MQTKADKGRGLMFTVFLQTSFMDDDPLGIEGAYKEADLKKLGKRLQMADLHLKLSDAVARSKRNEMTRKNWNDNNRDIDDIT